jgi:hypothetical protein
MVGRPREGSLPSADMTTPPESEQAAPLPRNLGAQFKPGDRVGLFVASMCMAANDIQNALELSVEANPPDHPDPDIGHRRRFGYWVRLTQGHLFEAIDALTSWREAEGKVRALIATLPAEAKADLAMICGLEQRLGPRVIEVVRQSTFHYPHPDRRRNPDSTEALTQAIEREREAEAGIEVDEDRNRVHFRFADQLALSMAISGHDDERLDEQVTLVRDGAIALVRSVHAIYAKFCEERGIGFIPAGDPIPEFGPAVSPSS